MLYLAGLTGISPLSLLLVLLIVLLLFGTKRLKTIGKDIGDAVRGFQKGMKDEEDSIDEDKKE